MRDLPKLKLELNTPEKFGNIAAHLDADERRTLAVDLIELIHVDEGSMSDWLGRARGYLDKTEPDSGNERPQDREQEGSGEEPEPATELTLTSVVQFSARATAALLGEPDLAKANETGAEPLAQWVSSEVRTRDPNWVLETDPLVVHFSVTGLAWRKRAFDREDKVFHSYFCPCTEIIINKSVRNVERAPRITHHFTRYPYEIDRSIRRKHWVDYKPQYNEADPQAEKKFYECDTWLDLDGDFIEEPWTVTISLDDVPEVVRIEPRWSKKTVVETSDTLFFKPVRRFYPYRFLPDPKGGFFPIGFGALLDRTEATADMLLGAIVDTAKTEAENGGVMAGGGTGLPTGAVEVKNNRVTTIPTDGRPLTDMFQPWPQKSVSSGSVAVLEKVITLADRIAGTLNLLENAPASMTATLAKGLIDNGTQVQSAVHRRLCTSMTQEFHWLVQMADAYDVLVDDKGTPISASGVNNVAVTADPAMATEMQRSAMGGLYMELLEQAAGGVPWNVSELQRRICQVMRIPEPEALISQPSPPQATPHEKMQGVIGLMKARTEQIKAVGAVAQQLTQGIKNIVDAQGGVIDQRAALANIMQLEILVQQMMGSADAASTGLDGMAPQPGNGSPPGLPSPAPAPDGGAVPAGAAGDPGATGAGASVPGAGESPVPAG